MTFIPFKIMAVIFFIAIINPLYTQNIKGRVLNYEDSPISGVSVILDNEVITKTNAEGFFTLPKLVARPLKLKLEHPDYFIKSITLSRSERVFKLIALNKTEDLEEVIISSTYQKESKVIIPTSNITAQQFDAFSPADVVAAINETPGVYIQSGAINTNRIIIRGVGSRTLYGTNKIRAYFNGIPITNGTGETAIDAFDPEDLENLEIVKGPKATQYGTNLGGTLLLNSKQALIGETYVKNNLTVGSFGLLKNNVSVATANEKFSFNMNYDHLESDGFRDNSNYNRNTILVTSNYKFNTKNEIGVLINYTDYYAQIPSSISKSAFEEDPTQAAFTWGSAQGYEDNKQVLTGIHYTHRFSETFSNTTTLFYSYLDHYEPRPFNILDEFTNGYGARTLFAKDFNVLNNKANLSFGGELYKDEYHWKTIENLYEDNNGNGSLEGELLSDNIEKRNNLNVFATVTLPFTEHLKAQLGLNFNTTNYNFTDVFNTGENNKNANRNFAPIFAPNLNVLYQFNSNINVFANISRGFNYPSIEETLTPEGVVNPELGPETGFNYEIGSELFLFNSKLQMKLNAYLLNIENALVADRIGDDQYIGRNAGKTQHKGIEVSVLYRHAFSNGFYMSPYLNLDLSDNKFITFIDDENDYSGNDLTGVPDTKLSGGINLEFRNFNLNTNFLHVGEMPMNDLNTLYSDPYTVCNTKLSYNTQLTEHLYINLNVGVNNFTNEVYASSILINAVGFGGTEPRYYYPGMPRNAFGGIKIGYTI